MRAMRSNPHMKPCAIAVVRPGSSIFFGARSVAQFITLAKE